MNPPFAVQKLGHVVVNVTDLEASKRFYTEVLGFRISDIYGGDKMPGGMVFLRCNGDHHCLALIGGLPADGEAKRRCITSPSSSPRSTRCSAPATICRSTAPRSSSRAAAAPAARSRSSSSIPTAITSNSTGASTRSAMTAARGPEEEWRQTMSLEDAVRIAPPGQDTTLHDKALSDRIGAGTDRA